MSRSSCFIMACLFPVDKHLKLIYSVDSESVCVMVERPSKYESRILERYRAQSTPSSIISRIPSDDDMNFFFWLAQIDPNRRHVLNPSLPIFGLWIRGYR